MIRKPSKRLQALAEDLGLTLSSLVDAQFKQRVNRWQSVLDTPYPDQFMNSKLEAELNQVYKEVKRESISQSHANLDNSWMV